jgi:cation:H+ antiporter
MLIQSIVLLIVGLALLVGGGNWFVDGAAGLARLLRVRPLIIGVVIIGFGTSTPELLVSLFALADGNGGIALGNIVGSNIANIGLVLALAAVVYPLVVANSVLRRELPLMALVTLLFSVLVMIDGRLDALDGALLVAAFGAAMLYMLGLPGRRMDREAAEMIVESPVLEIPRRPLVAVGQTVVGLALILVGAQLTVDNAATLARQFGVSDAVIGLTLVAVGTSLPELVAALISAWKRETDLIVGNVLGSNLYNLGFTGGLVGLFSGAGLAVEDALRFGSVGAMLVLTLLLVPLLFRGSRLTRLEGAVVLVGYVVYTALLF